jgi:hypothetical protein
MAAAINWFQAIRIRLLISVAHIEVGFGVHFGSGFLVDFVGGILVPFLSGFLALFFPSR